MTNTVSNVAPVQAEELSPADMTKLAQIGESFDKLESDRDNVFKSFLAVLGDNPSYDRYMQARAGVIQGFKVRWPKANDDWNDQRFARFVKACKEFCERTGEEQKFPQKPKAATPAAEAMRKARHNPYADMTRAEVTAVMEELAEKITSGDLSKETIDAHGKARARFDAIAKAEEKASEKAIKDANKARREPLIAWIKEAPSDVLAVVEFLRDALCENTPDDDKVQAWKNLAALAKKHTAPVKPAK